ncbi:Signal transduction histidine kinase [Agromyces sp. CF514]|uniref:sensor histidine kinase n=1 Tax=Agromyces sp. CF514 TaxID=1881031 RepID=UPI0008EF6A7A|nr:sensor histidine kinase [Agromyces sp. CF514]SFR72143.1 Signal transduction histidine kinase [Agromyces sp. CF514]
MTLGLPGDVSRDSVGRAIVHAGHVAGWVYLGLGALVALTMAFGGEPSGWIAAGLALVMIGLLSIVALSRTLASTLLYLLAGGAATAWMTALAMRSGYDLGTTDNAVVAIPCIALVLVGGSGSGSVVACVWVAVAYGVSQLAVWVGAMLSGSAFHVSIAATAVAAFVMLIRAVDGLTRRAGLRRQAALVRANVAVREATARRDHELEAITRLHDTAMVQLLAIASTGSGPIDERLRADIRHDLSLLVGRDWFARHGGEPRIADPVVTADGMAVLDQAFAMAADDGLDVQMTGDLAVLALLGPLRAAELDGAVAECLHNVARHAGVDEAEIVLGSGGGEVTVAVMDVGSGFDVDRVPAGRRGLREVVARLEREGGSTRVWSAIGLGTTVVLAMPMGGA